jgi:hypothetical protein
MRRRARRRFRRYKPGVNKPGTDAPTPDANPQPGSRFSALARASAIVGSVSVLVSCCGGGIGGSIAVILGFIALERIRASGGALRGKATAIAGVTLGFAAILVTIGVQFIVGNVQTAMRDQLDTAVRTTFAAVDDAGGDAALDRWGAAPGTVVTTADLERFALAARERYGDFQSYSVASEVPAPSLTGVHRLSLAVNFEFANGTVPGSVQARISTGRIPWEPQVLLEAIAINDHAKGVLGVGAVPPEQRSADAAQPVAEGAAEPTSAGSANEEPRPEGTGTEAGGTS